MHECLLAFAFVAGATRAGPGDPTTERNKPAPALPPLQALGQPFEVGLLPSCRDPAELVRALAVSDADGWRFCLVPADGRRAARSCGGDAPAAMEE
jgi:catechol 2,3-dioxygenase-like lactoylglutathione lyase family enzyme